ncbi:serine/threonine-protein kinase, partial [Micromonospora sp. NPDC005163]
MGRVWLARDEMLHRDVAVKEVVPPSWLAETERAELRLRTLREARTAARLNHPNVVRIYDVVHDRESPWIVMEYVPSRSVQQIIGAEGPLSPQRTARIGLAVLAALRAAHTAGVLHRDVKPHNVLVADDGRVVLTDFGLATFVGGDGAMTEPGMVLGSPQFVAPERAREGVSNPRTDLWSLGATLYAMVEGRSPYARSSAMATLRALATEPPDPMRRAGSLRPVLTGLLQRDPWRRLTAAEAEPLLRGAAADDDPPTEPA